MKFFKAVIYDIDGTILNTLNMNMYPLIRIIREETGEEWSFEKVLKFAAYPGMKVMEELKVKNPEQVYARWVKYVNEYEEGAVLYDGFEEVLPKLGEKFRQAVVSAKTREQYEIDFCEKGLDRYMETAVLAGDTREHKPNPEPLLKCAERLRVAPEEAVYVGDARSDQEAARRAGMTFGYAGWGNEGIPGMGLSEEQILSEGGLVFRRPLDLLKLLEYAQ